MAKFLFFPCNKAHPHQAGFFLRFFAWLTDMVIVILLSLFLLIAYTQVRAAFSEEQSLASRIVQSLQEGKSMTISLESKEHTEQRQRRIYLNLLKDWLSQEEYVEAEKMPLSDLLNAFSGLLANQERPRDIIYVGETYQILYELIFGYLYFLYFFRFGGRPFGKRIFGLRVIDLRGEDNLGWYQAFERTHGYAASALVAAIGFLQVLWDPSGLTMHDKIAATTVVKMPPKRLRLKVSFEKEKQLEFDYSDLLR
jgi:uncharacterized RDD family membrane protein YckC